MSNNTTKHHQPSTNTHANSGRHSKTYKVLSNINIKQHPYNHVRFGKINFRSRILRDILRNSMNFSDVCMNLFLKSK